LISIFILIPQTGKMSELGFVGLKDCRIIFSNSLNGLYMSKDIQFASYSLLSMKIF